MFLFNNFLIKMNYLNKIVKNIENINSLNSFSLFNAQTLLSYLIK